MILSDRTILKMLEERTLTIEPVTKEQIQPASVDIRLGRTFSVVDDTPSSVITLENEIKYKTITTDTYLIIPGQFVFAEMDDHALNPYDGKYQDQKGATGSRVFKDTESPLT